MEDNDEKLLPYDWVPGWYRYLDSLRVTDYLVLKGNRYVTVASLQADHDAKATTLDTAHNSYRVAVRAALDEADPALKERLHQVAVDRKAALSEAATQESDSYVALMDAVLAAPR